MLSVIGDISTFSTDVNPVAFECQWKMTGGFKKLNCFTGIHCNRKHMAANFLPKQYIFLVGGTAEGQIIYRDPLNYGEEGFLVQVHDSNTKAHLASINSIMCTESTEIADIVLTAAMDNHVKLWEVTWHQSGIGNLKNISHFQNNQSRLLVGLRLYSDIQVPEFDGAPRKVCFLPSLGILAVSTDKFRGLIFKQSQNEHRNLN
jgi:hypothetical protein